MAVVRAGEQAEDKAAGGNDGAAAAAAAAGAAGAQAAAVGRVSGAVPYPYARPEGPAARLPLTGAHPPISKIYISYLVLHWKGMIKHYMSAECQAVVN